MAAADRLLFFSGSLHGRFAARLSSIYDHKQMLGYVLYDDLKGEGVRLALIAHLFDPMRRRYIIMGRLACLGMRTQNQLHNWAYARAAIGGTRLNSNPDFLSASIAGAIRRANELRRPLLPQSTAVRALRMKASARRL